jgi:hypothetical protein
MAPERGDESNDVFRGLWERGKNEIEREAKEDTEVFKSSPTWKTS